MRYRTYKTERAAERYCDKLRAIHPDKEFVVRVAGWRYAVALLEDGRFRAYCA